MLVGWIIDDTWMKCDAEDVGLIKNFLGKGRLNEIGVGNGGLCSA